MTTATGMAFSIDVRRAVARAYDGGAPVEVAEQLGCSPSFVRKLVVRRASADTLEPRPLGRKSSRRRCNAADEANIRELDKVTFDLTLAEVAAAVRQAGLPGHRLRRRWGCREQKIGPRGRAGPARRGRAAGGLV